MTFRKSGSDAGFVAVQRALLLCVSLMLASCGWLSAYRIDIQQGNVVDAAQVAQLRAGLTKDQVRFVLGTPLLTDVFHPERWDYLYSLDRRLAEQIERSRLTVFFAKDGTLERWIAEVPPASADVPMGRVIDLGGVKKAEGDAADSAAASTAQ